MVCRFYQVFFTKGIIHFLAFVFGNNRTTFLGPFAERKQMRWIFIRTSIKNDMCRLRNVFN